MKDVIENQEGTFKDQLKLLMETVNESKLEKMSAQREIQELRKQMEE